MLRVKSVKVKGALFVYSCIRYSLIVIWAAFGSMLFDMFRFSGHSETGQVYEYTLNEYTNNG